MNADEFDKAITIRANAYARGASDDVLEQIAPFIAGVTRNGSDAYVQMRAHIDRAIARAFVVGLAAGIEVERGPTDRRPSRGKVRR